MGVSVITRQDLESAIRLMGDAGAGLAYDQAVSTLLTGIPRLVPSELTTLSFCDLAHGRRTVISSPSRALGPEEIGCFDRFFDEHPLVRYHATHRDGGTWRISDSLSWDSFRASALYNEYYRRIGLDRATAMPVANTEGLLVSFVLNRKGRDFSDRDIALLDLLREPVAKLLRARRAIAAEPALAKLTRREREVLDWVARGKTNADIGVILAISARTVQKHLENVFVKLGVESRTAAARRKAGSPPTPG
jgi:DNA-binding CsgD family transcriptional regulator